jgi:hypothetical protein
LSSSRRNNNDLTACAECVLHSAALFWQSHSFLTYASPSSTGQTPASVATFSSTSWRLPCASEWA